MHKKFAQQIPPGIGKIVALLMSALIATDIHLPGDSIILSTIHTNGINNELFSDGLKETLTRAKKPGMRLTPPTIRMLFRSSRRKSILTCKLIIK